MRLTPFETTSIKQTFTDFFGDENFIVTNILQYFLALDQLEEHLRFKIQNSKFLLELVGKHIAPVIALACMIFPFDEIILITSSNHLIKNEAECEKVLVKGKGFAMDSKLVTFDISPTFLLKRE